MHNHTEHGRAILPDFGPWYAETDLSRFPVEPCNTYSNTLFLLVAIYWALKISKIESQKFKSFLKISLPLLLVGYVGGTVYHATRSHLGWMLMDVIPIYFLGLLTSIYHWRLLNLSLVKIIVIFLSFFCAPVWLLWKLFPASPNTPTLGYMVLASSVLIPLLLDQWKQNWKQLGSLLITVLSISIALSFRALDSSELVAAHFQWGTHWLWHSFGAITCHLLLLFMWQRSKELA